MGIERNQTSDLSILKNGKVVSLPYGWAFKDIGSYSFRNNLQDRAFTHGSDMTGDGTVEGRTVTIEFDARGATEEEHDNAVNFAYQIFNGTNYQIKAGRADRIYRVAGVQKISHEFREGYKQRWSNITISLLLADPFRYATEATNISVNYTEAQEEAEIKINNISAVDVPLIWTFAPPEGGTAADITIEHVESGKSFSLKDTLLTAPAVAVVNAETGTVRRDTGNSLNTFSGIFLHALAGENTYRYSGAPCNVKITFTPRWFL